MKALWTIVFLLNMMELGWWLFQEDDSLFHWVIIIIQAACICGLAIMADKNFVKEDKDISQYYGRTESSL